MKISKDIRQLSRHLVRDSYVNGALDRERINAIGRAITELKPRNYAQLLKNYHRLLQLELDKKKVTIESASELDAEAGRQIVSGLEKSHGAGLMTNFIINPALLGGVRIRVGSDVWDSSVRNRLDRLRQKL
ncbi:MAG: F0F1 ATP synthase subunit delta [Chthoniobacterales bacterium]